MGEAARVLSRSVLLFVKRNGSKFSFGKLSRLLILFSFFNFCGLNNGLTFFVVSAGKTEVCNLTPLFIHQSCRIFNPSYIKKCVISSWQSLFFPKKAIVISSQALVQKIIIEASSIGTARLIGRQVVSFFGTNVSQEITSRAAQQEKNNQNGEMLFSSRDFAGSFNSRNEIWISSKRLYSCLLKRDYLAGEKSFSSSGTGKFNRYNRYLFLNINPSMGGVVNLKPGLGNLKQFRIWSSIRRILFSSAKSDEEPANFYTKIIGTPKNNPGVVVEHRDYFLLRKI